MWWQNLFAGRTKRHVNTNVASSSSGGGMTAIPVQQQGQKVSPHEFLEAQLLNLPDEEESRHKRWLFAIIYVVATWGGSILMVLLGYGLSLDLQDALHVNGAYAFALNLLFPFAELLIEALAILIGERIHQGLKSHADWRFVWFFAPIVLFANAGTAMLQVYLMTLHVEGLTQFAMYVLWGRAFLPLVIAVTTVGVVAGIQRRSLTRMVAALDRKAVAVTKMAESSVAYLEATMTASRMMDEHQDARDQRSQQNAAWQTMQGLMQRAFDQNMEQISALRAEQDQQMLQAPSWQSAQRTQQERRQYSPPATDEGYDEGYDNYSDTEQEEELIVANDQPRHTTGQFTGRQSGHLPRQQPAPIIPLHTTNGHRPTGGNTPQDFSSALLGTGMGLEQRQFVIPSTSQQGHGQEAQHGSGTMPSPSPLLRQVAPSPSQTLPPQAEMNEEMPAIHKTTGAVPSEQFQPETTPENDN